jgi:hypothetical protein
MKISSLIQPPSGGAKSATKLREFTCPDETRSVLVFQSHDA